MNKYTVELDFDTIDRIVVEQLQYTKDSMARDLKLRCNGEGMAIFSTDIDKDVREIAKHVEAASLILSYYGVKDE